MYSTYEDRQAAREAERAKREAGKAARQQAKEQEKIQQQAQAAQERRNPVLRPQTDTDTGGHIEALGNIGAGTRQDLQGYTPGVYTATTQQVAEPGLVENRVTGLLGSNSPYMKQAAAAGRREAATRGLLNSSIAAGASQDAAIRAALPIAQQDASSVNQQSLANQQAENQASQFNAGQTSEANRFLSSARNDVTGRTMDAAMREQSAQYDQRRAEDLRLTEANINEQLARFDQARALELQDLKSSYEQLIERDKSANTVYQQYLSEMGKVLSADLSAERRKEALSALYAGIESQMKFIHGIAWTGAESAA